MYKNTDCSILVLSCDKNKALLKIFFDFFDKNWNKCPFEIYLGLEKEVVNHKNVIALQSENSDWSGRLVSYLNIIKSDYIFIILDDFILEDVANTKKIMSYLEYIKSNEDIVNISLANIYDNNNTDIGFENLVERPKDADYLLNLQVGIWRKDILLLLLKLNESPWETEIFGSIRARRLKNKRFLCLKDDEYAPYKYGRGWLMVRGFWNGNEIKRLKLESYLPEIFDGRDILFTNQYKDSFKVRVLRRINIMWKKILSFCGLY